MKLISAKFSIVSLIIFCLTASAQAAISADLNKKITHMIKSNLPDANVGVIVQNANTGEILYDYQGGTHFTPASTTKLFTAAAALKYLGPEYRYATDLYYQPQTLQNGTHQGDVVLKFNGDPSFQLASLYSLLQKLADAKIKAINGNLLIDDSEFIGPMWAMGWTWDSTPWHHAAPVAAIIIDRNQFGVTLFPAPKPGGKVSAKLDPDPSSKFRTITADVRAVTFEDSETICQLAVYVDEKNNLELGGCWPLGNEPQHLRFAIKNPRLQAAQLIAEALQKLDITLAGKITFGPLPPNTVKLAHHSSEPLYVLLKPMLNESNNLYAESITKTLGSRVNGAGSFKAGANAVQKVLTDFTGIDFTQARLLDGSGDSRYNLLTPKHLARLLFSMGHERNINLHFRNALAISGMNGTLQNRFTKMAPQVRAKTGTLNGVSTLAGYFTSKHKQELIVAIMINNALESNVLLRQFEDDLCYFLMDQM